MHLDHKGMVQKTQVNDNQGGPTCAFLYAFAQLHLILAMVLHSETEVRGL